MLSLQGKMSSINLTQVKELTKLRFKRASDFKTAEALIVYEQKMLDTDILRQCCEVEYGIKFDNYVKNFVAKELIDFYKDKNFVPVNYSVSTNTVTLITVPEYEKEYIETYANMKVIRKVVPIYEFIKEYTHYYGTPKYLYEIPTEIVFEMIIQEALAYKAQDITLSEQGVYFSINKHRVESKRSMSPEDLKGIVNIICLKGKSPYIEEYNKPKYVSIELDNYTRGRVCINKGLNNFIISIRVLPNTILDYKLEDLHLESATVRFINKVYTILGNGLHLIIGPTESGKNTTSLVSLMTFIKSKQYKIVSIECPVEQRVYGIEQIPSETDEEYVSNVASLIRQNPDIVYISEMNDYTAIETLKIANSGKPVFSTIHANSIAEVIPRIYDLTGYNLDRIILNMHSAIYQNLVYDKDYGMRPISKYIEFTEGLKDKLMGKSLSEIIRIVRDLEENRTSSIYI